MNGTITKLRRCAIVAGVFLTLSASAASIPRPSASHGGSFGSVTVRWEAPNYASWGYTAQYGYYVYRTPTANFRNAIKLGRTSNRFWVDRTAGQGRKYWYWVAPIYNRYATYDYFWRGNTRYRRTTWWYQYYIPSPGTSGHEQQAGWRRVTIPRPTVSRGKSTYGLYVSWTSSPQAKYGYRVYRSRTPYWSGTCLVGTTSNRYFVDYNAKRGVTYYYWIAPRCFNFTPHQNDMYGWGYLR